MADITDLVADLRAEGAALDGLVAPLAAQDWARGTPAEGWTIAHQIAHLAWTDHCSVLAATDEAAFTEVVTEAWSDPTGFVDRAAEEGAAAPPEQILADWRAGREQIAEVLLAVPDGTRLPWFGPPMSAASMATARIMETWAHGQDVADALGARRTPTARLRHVAHIGVRARDFAYAVHELPAPDAPFRVELRAPGGELWTWGPEDAEQSVTGEALDFALLATQRRHRDDTALRAVGAEADRWLSIIQAFAGAPGGGRRPLA